MTLPLALRVRLQSDEPPAYFASLEASIPPTQKSRINRTPRDGRYRSEPGPADASTGCRQHAHLAVRPRSG
jgi:hypothetical protein